MMRDPIRVAVTGAAGNIGYALIFRIANGDLFGPQQPVILQLLEIPPAMGALEGVAMELDDCAFPLLTQTVLTDEPDVAFAGANWSLLVGARPRTAGMARKDLLSANGPIFVSQGRPSTTMSRPTLALSSSETRQYQLPDRHAQRARRARRTLHRHDSPRSQSRQEHACPEGWQAAAGRKECYHLGQSQRHPIP